MPELKFTNEQRFIIAMLCDLYKKPDERDLKPDLILSAISGGHDWAIEWEYNGLIPDHSDSKEHVEFVANTLEMWRFIENGYSKLGSAERQKVKDAIPYLGDGPVFIGFDGNNETDYLCTAQMMVSIPGRFDSFKGRSLNSHMPKVGRYADMLKSWPDIRKTLSSKDMTADQLIELLSRE